ncbi:hypothetical protein FCH79_25895 [Pseudomonas koreensis]|nr:hypothetical protein [Pseudomonas koreensis]
MEVDEPVARELAPAGARSGPALHSVEKAGPAAQASGSKLPRHGLSVISWRISGLRCGCKSAPDRDAYLGSPADSAHPDSAAFPE